MSNSRATDAGPRTVMGIDVGATKILTGLVTADAKILRTGRYRMVRDNQDSAVRSVLNAIDDSMKASQSEIKPEAIGVGLVGHVDHADGVWSSCMNIPITTPVLLADRLSRVYNVPAVLDNDVHAATMAEIRWGIGKKSGNFIYINIGSGIAAGIVSDGRLVRGASNYAGEIGHMTVEAEGEECICGQTGCLETISSGGGIAQVAESLLDRYPDSVLNKFREKEKLSAELVFQAEGMNDELSKIIIGRSLRGMGATLTNLANALNPEAIVLGGGLAKNDRVMEYLRAYIDSHALPKVKKALKSIALSSLNPDEVGLLGAAALALETERQAT